MTDALNALSPLDGRYAKQADNLRPIFSEYGLIKRRVFIEVNWLLYLSNDSQLVEISGFSKQTIAELKKCAEEFSFKDAKSIKAIEKITNHDVKAVEYWLKKKFKNNQEISKASEFIHFACTSEDINNLSYALLIKDGLHNELIPLLQTFHETLRTLAKKYSSIPMLARTHGQTASPTTLGKEFANVAYRLKRQLDQLRKKPILGKMNGAVGNFNAHMVSFPKKNWNTFSKNFIQSLGLQFNPYTTQIEPHDFMAEIFNSISLINTIIIDLNRDLWGYISLGYFNQKLKKNEVGSSTMPHKVNPIDFENSEGNLGLANAILRHLADKLPISRFQRDLTDSTVLRNIGIGFGYSFIAYQACLKGLSKLEVNTKKLEDDLNAAWEVLAEPIQTVMRKHGIKNPYEKLKALTRGNKNISKASLQSFISKLDIPDEDKSMLLNLSPSLYIGNAAQLAKKI